MQTDRLTRGYSSIGDQQVNIKIVTRMEAKKPAGFQSGSGEFCFFLLKLSGAEDFLYCAGGIGHLRTWRWLAT